MKVGLSQLQDISFFFFQKKKKKKSPNPPSQTPNGTNPKYDTLLLHSQT